MRYIISVLLLVLSMPASAAQKRDYKCYLETTSGFEIGMYAWNVKQQKKQMSKLIGKPFHKSDKKTSYIKAVEECVFTQADFNSEAAQKLDKVTLR